CLSTRSGLVDMPQISEEHVIYRTQIRVEALTLTEVLIRQEYMPAYVQFKHPLLISHPKIYPYVLSSNSATLGACYFFILFTFVLLDADLAIEALEVFR
ncbi:unnamed protein product, partial [marine sediment metagenome]